jgi:CRISPR system Cascade subunit CasB
MDGRVRVLALTNDLLQWGEQVKKRWAYAYEWPARTSS